MTTALTTKSMRDLLRVVEEDPDLAFDVAMALEGRLEDVDLGVVLQEHQVTQEELALLMGVPAFERVVVQIRTDIRENGLSFKRKAAALAEAFLPMVAGICRDVEVSPHVRLDGVSKLAKWGGMEKAAGEGNKGGVVINIQVGDQTISTAVTLDGAIDPDA